MAKLNDLLPGKGTYIGSVGLAAVSLYLMFSPGLATFGSPGRDVALVGIMLAWLAYTQRRALDNMERRTAERISRHTLPLE